jgi:hypothetical protein
MRTGRGKHPAWTIFHSVVRPTPIIWSTCRVLMNRTSHLLPYAPRNSKTAANQDSGGLEGKS